MRGICCKLTLDIADLGSSLRINPSSQEEVSELHAHPNSHTLQREYVHPTFTTNLGGFVPVVELTERGEGCEFACKGLFLLV